MLGALSSNEVRMRSKQGKGGAKGKGKTQTTRDVKESPSTSTALSLVVEASPEATTMAMIVDGGITHTQRAGKRAPDWAIHAVEVQKVRTLIPKLY